MPRVWSSVHGVLAGILLASAGPALGAPSSPVEIGHNGVGCVVAEHYPAFDARVQPPDNVGAARVYFRTAGSPHWYWVSMSREGEGFRGILPKPTKSLKSFDYYIEATDREMATARTKEFSPTVAAGMGACNDKMGTPALASARVAVGAPQGAPPLPAGFSNAGVLVATAGASAGVGAAAGGGGAGAAGAVAGGGISKGLIIGGAVVAAGGVAVAVAAGGGGGESTGGGVPACVPGPVTASAQPTALVSACGQPSPVTTITLRNQSCQPVTVSAIEVARTDTRNICNFPGFRNPPSTATVAAGATQTVGSFGGGLYCVGGVVRTEFTCVDHTSVVVQSSAGPLAAGTYDVTVQFPAGCATICQ